MRETAVPRGSLLVRGALLASIGLVGCEEPSAAGGPPPPSCSRASYDLRQLTGLADPLGPRALRAEDVTGDGQADLLVLLKEKDSLVVLRGDSGRGFSLLESLPVGSTPNDLAVADLDRDGNRDVLLVGHFSDALTVLMGAGGGAFRAPTTYPLGNHSQRLELADFDADGHLDVVTKNGGSAGNFTLTVLLGRGDGTFGAAVPYTVSDAPMDLALADLDQDGREDVLVAVANRKAVEIWRGRGDGTLSRAGEVQLSDDPLRIAMSDVDGDGRRDLLVMHGLSEPGYMGIHLGAPDGTFQPEQRIVLPSPVELVSTDLDGDGAEDAALSSLEGSLLLLKRRPEGYFEAPRSLSSGGWATSLAARDLDANGHVDLSWTRGEGHVEVMFDAWACDVASAMASVSAR